MDVEVYIAERIKYWNDYYDNARTDDEIHFARIIIQELRCIATLIDEANAQSELDAKGDWLDQGL